MFWDLFENITIQQTYFPIEMNQLQARLFQNFLITGSHECGLVYIKCVRYLSPYIKMIYEKYSMCPPFLSYINYVQHIRDIQILRECILHIVNSVPGIIGASVALNLPPLD